MITTNPKYPIITNESYVKICKREGCCWIYGDYVTTAPRQDFVDERGIKGRVPMMLNNQVNITLPDFTRGWQNIGNYS